jgi:hypothetical protein
MLRERGRVKTVIGATDLSLSPQAKESYRVRKILTATSSGAFASVYVDKVLVAYIRQTGDRGSHSNFLAQSQQVECLWNYLIEKGIFRPIPIAKGSTLTISGVNQSTSKQAVVYDAYDPDDVKETEPNGPQSKEYDFIQYGRYTTTLAAGDNLLSVQQTSAQYPAFPFGRSVPSKHRMILRGIAFSDIGYTTGTDTNEQATHYLKLIRNREVLFDEDKNGLPYYTAAATSDATNVGKGYSIAGDLSSADLRLPLIFPEPMVFNEGDDLDVYVNTAVAKGSANITAALGEVGLIFNVQLT